MDNTFVRKDFYVNPPAKDASAEEWEKWLKKDKQAAIQAKRAFNKTLEQAELPEFAQGTSMRRINGVWKQSTAIGFVGDVENGGSLEPMVEENQMRDYIRARLTGTDRGVSHARSATEKRKARRARRKARKQGKE